jgi:PhnB protein
MKAKPRLVETRITPYLLYEDVGSALDWLARAFGFREQGMRMQGPDGKINHAEMELAGSPIMIGDPGPKYKNPKRLGQVTQNLYVMVDDVDKHFARARKVGATILVEPEDQPYGHRRYGVTDPEGHVWYFAQPVKKRARARSAKKK